MLNIDLYGIKRYEVDYLFDFDRNVLENLSYESYNKNNPVFTINVTKKNGIYNTRSGVLHDDPEKYKSFNIKNYVLPSIGGNIYSLFEKHNNIKLLSAEKHKKFDFEVTLPNSNKKLTIDFDDTCRVMYDEDYNIAMSYESDENRCLDGSKLIETFWFNSKGYYYENRDNEYSSLLGDTEVNFNIESINTPISIDILTKLPDMITYSNNKEFRLFYDKYGLVKNIIDRSRSDTDSDLIKYQVEDFSDNIISLHPLFYDAFDYRYIDQPFKYWAIDTISPTLGIFKRIVFEIKGNTELIDLLSFIKNEESII